MNHNQRSHLAFLFEPQLELFESFDLKWISLIKSYGRVELPTESAPGVISPIAQFLTRLSNKRTLIISCFVALLIWIGINAYYLVSELMTPSPFMLLKSILRICYGFPVQFFTRPSQPEKEADCNKSGPF